MTLQISANRNNNIGVIHFLAALFVMYGHQCALLNQSVPLFFGCGIHTIGVKIIFVLSGYLITASLWNLNNKNRLQAARIYCIKRLRRIYPELLGCLLFSAFIVGPLFTQYSFDEYLASIEWVWFYVKNNLLMFPVYSLPGMFLNNPYSGAVNGSLWTMPVELFMYFVILIIFLSSRNMKIKKSVYGIVTLVVSCMFLFRIASFPGTSFVVYGTDWVQALNVIPYYLIGGIFFLFNIQKYLNLQIASFLFLALASLNFSAGVINEAICLVILPYFIMSLALAKENNLHLRFVKSEYAYGMYLYGFVIQQCIIQKLFIETRMICGTFLLYFLSVIATYIMAALSYNMVYRPISNIINKLMNRHLSN